MRMCMPLYTRVVVSTREEKYESAADGFSSAKHCVASRLMVICAVVLRWMFLGVHCCSHLYKAVGQLCIYVREGVCNEIEQRKILTRRR
jgi:hypothetical protein